MSNQWLRLWHDLPNDPKWRTISRASGQRIGDVISVYIHLLVCASNANERGRTQSFCSEDVASALDINIDQVDAILAAMQGRVMDSDRLTGWANRQSIREDGSADRARAWRALKKAEIDAKNDIGTDDELERTQANASERKRTLDTDKNKNNTSVENDKIVFDGSSFQNINGRKEIWAKAYPAINVDNEIAKAAAWIASNPKNKKSAYDRFLNGWLNRAQDRAPRAHSGDIFKGGI